jgi:hypothetical protein
LNFEEHCPSLLMLSKLEIQHVRHLVLLISFYEYAKVVIELIIILKLII